VNVIENIIMLVVETAEHLVDQWTQQVAAVQAETDEQVVCEEAGEEVERQEAHSDWHIEHALARGQYPQCECD
jgi:hypothetical protein